jgi:hypothetical protein
MFPRGWRRRHVIAVESIHHPVVSGQEDAVPVCGGAEGGPGGAPFADKGSKEREYEKKMKSGRILNDKLGDATTATAPSCGKKNAPVWQAALQFRFACCEVIEHNSHGAVGQSDQFPPKSEGQVEE